MLQILTIDGVPESRYAVLIDKHGWVNTMYAETGPAAHLESPYHMSGDGLCAPECRRKPIRHKLHVKMGEIWSRSGDGLAAELLFD